MVYREVQLTAPPPPAPPPVPNQSPLPRPRLPLWRMSERLRVWAALPPADLASGGPQWPCRHPPRRDAAHGPQISDTDTTHTARETGRPVCRPAHLFSDKGNGLVHVPRPKPAPRRRNRTSSLLMNRVWRRLHASKGLTQIRPVTRTCYSF